jgi:hypothetical protein
MVSELRARQLTAGRERPVNGGDFATASAPVLAGWSRCPRQRPPMRPDDPEEPIINVRNPEARRTTLSLVIFTESRARRNLRSRP